MKVTKENVFQIEGFADFGLRRNINVRIKQELLKELLTVLEDEINKHMPVEKRLYIDYEDKHTEYSAERVDPCPDYYGCFTLRLESNPYEVIGDYMTLEDLDSAMLFLSDYRNVVLD